jgi:uracil-DNA glycosylase family 4
MIYIKPTGPREARIAIVGEAPGRDEEQAGRPFCGAAGYELTTQMRDAGIPFHECFVTNVIRFRPEGNDIEHFITPVKKRGEERKYELLDGMWVAPFVREHIQTLMFELEECKPHVIVALGNTALWALANKTGITKWRGSQMLTKWGQKLVPIVHPALVLREYSWRATSVLDFKQRVKPESYAPDFHPPEYNFTIKPSFGQVAAYLAVLEEDIKAQPRFHLTLDLETRRGQIACLGFGTSARKAFCIPFLCVTKDGGHYWSLDEEVWIVEKLRKILTHPNLFLIGQNLLYDAQYIVHQFKFVPYVCQDTMLWHQTCFPGTPKALDFLASWYAEFYCYWKDEGKEWTSRMNEEELWHYNCLDCVYTYEVAARLTETVEKLHLQKQVHRQQSLFYPVLDMMLTGISVDQPKRGLFHKELEVAITKKNAYLAQVLGHPLNPRSAPQMQRLFYTDFKQTPIISRKTGAPTLDEYSRLPLLRRSLIRTGG